jgi:hypothetical protein
MISDDQGKRPVGVGTDKESEMASQSLRRQGKFHHPSWTSTPPIWRTSALSFTRVSLMSQEKLTNVDTRLQNVETQVLTVNELAKDVDASLTKVDKDLDILTDGC